MTHRLLLLLGALLSATFAQTGTSVLTGTSTDASGAPLPNVAITLTNTDSGARIATLTNESGNYRLGSLTPGNYKLEAELPGFDKYVRTQIPINVSQVLAVDFTLQLGQTSNTVTVQEDLPLTETQSSSTGQLVNQRMVAGLPMPNRAATSLAALAPGVVMIDSGQGAENYPVFSIAGGRARNQNFTLDGGNVTNAVGLTRPQQMTSLPMDAMQEFRVISNNYSAENGHSTGGIITLSTRSGTNAYHGSLFEFLRNNALDARNFFAAQRPPLRLNQFGGSLGGPIQKDKTHFFLTWEQTRQISSTIALQTVPTLAQRAGAFSTPIYDPATTVGRDRQPFTNNTIPDSRFDPVARNILAYYPLPNRAGSANGANNYAANSNSTLTRNIVVGRLDHQLRASDQLSARYYINDSYIANTGSFTDPVAAPDANWNDARIQSVLVSHTHIFRPTLVNELKVSYLQRKFIDDRFGAFDNLAARVGLTGVSAAAFPNFNLPGYASLSSNSMSRHQTPIRDTQILESVSWLRGTHAFKFGGEFRMGSNNEIRDRTSSGSFGITPLITGLPGVANTGNSLASFLLGEVNSVGIQASDPILSKAQYLSWFAQDDWRVTSNLTINYGFRWESELPRYVDNNAQNSFDTSAINPVSGTPGVVTFSGQNGVPRRAFRTDLNNFGPRLGVAWKAPHGFVLRGGGGVFYGPTVSNTIGDTASTGFSDAISLVVPQADLQSAIRLRDGVPVLARQPLNSSFGAVALGQKPNTSVGFFEQDRPTPISYQYNFNVQHELPGGTVVEAGYLANISHHLTANDLTLNQVAPQLMGAGDAQARRPFPQFSNVYWINPAIGNSTYHGGFLRTEKRFAKGFSFLAHYTFAKFLDDVASGNEYGDPQSYMDAYNRRLDKGLSGSDVTHRTVISALYEWRGWQLGSYVTLQSGAPFTVVSASNTTNAFPAGAVRPDLIGDPNAENRTVARWFNTAAFAAARPYSFGNSPRSGLRGPFQKTVDATLSRQFKLTEKFRTDLRGEFYNLLNTVNFDVPGHTLGAADFGTIQSSRPARTIQVGLRLSF
ncbi:carboxypeptidase-like regulatory domain-containing protein [uncultured Paludibaculum sp.]|uniref:TonB-dependent receptor n=1 Tax=uncultured Paludibaculum sp. TaxID=1765020 RepID=UPI002AABEA17|nr:carboxypeptidase-like regulatory domain-containing protein [uncultured Paludibaculum sp.]